MSDTTPWPPQALRVPVTATERPRFPVVSIHEHLGPVFGGDWGNRPVADLIANLDEAGIATMVDLGVTALIEVPPAGTLAGLAKRAMPDVEVVALKTPDDLDAARELVARHGVPSPMDSSPTWRMLVAPAKGIFHRTDAEPGAELEPGALVGHVSTNRDEQQITAPHGGVVVEWLVEDGDPVSPGQPVVRLHPHGSAS